MHTYKTRTGKRYHWQTPEGEVLIGIDGVPDHWLTDYLAERGVMLAEVWGAGFESVEEARAMIHRIYSALPRAGEKRWPVFSVLDCAAPSEMHRTPGGA